MDWSLDPTVTFLNHGSYGACPRAVLELQGRLRAELEAQPVRFLGRELEARMDTARRALGGFVGADPDDLAFLPNATAGVNTVLRSLDFRPGDELLTSDHVYGACRNALDAMAARAGARVVTVAIPFPLDSPEIVVERVLAAAGPKTRLALLDHVTSPTGLVLPIERLVAGLAERGVDTLVDGAHAPGMLPLDLRALGAAYYAANCHKWICAPKGSAFLHVRRDRQAGMRPLSISHGASDDRTDRSRFRLEFDWTGTHDPTAYLCVPEALRVVGAALPGGWPAVMDRNRALALQARARLLDVLGTAVPAPERMIGALAAIPLPRLAVPAPRRRDPLHVALGERFGIEVPVMSWPGGTGRALRISAPLYTTMDDFERLATALAALRPGASG
jgi:isopenicillin-N epimerase